MLMRESASNESMINAAEAPETAEASGVTRWARMLGDLSYRPRQKLPVELRDLINALAHR
jgi:hypothetical protein